MEINEKVKQVLSDASLELRQMHNHYQRDCKAGCPTLDVIARIEALLANK